MLAADWGLGEALWTLLAIFLFVIWFWLLITIFADLFRDHELSGWAKAGWTIFIILLPFLGILVYLIARGGGMAERQMAQEKAAKADFDAYVQEAAGQGASPSEQIAEAKKLLDAGTISQEEYDQLKAKALS